MLSRAERGPFGVGDERTFPSSREVLRVKAAGVSGLVSLAKKLRSETSHLSFEKAAYVYAPLDYAWPVASEYLRRYGDGPKEVVLVGMNPGPFGMAQTGVPFGEVSFVREWMKLEGKVGHPPREHPKRPVEGLACKRSEVSGKRLWGAIAKKHPDAATFFEGAFVLNYCPLLFLTETGANLTPDKLGKKACLELEEACDAHLAEALRLLDPDIAIGVGRYATTKIESLGIDGLRTGTIPHPSPASPAANADWEGHAKKALAALGLKRVL
jgi:single-strand selective monofunctional uracil DNA glycosylase